MPIDSIEVPGSGHGGVQIRHGQPRHFIVTVRTPGDDYAEVDIGAVDLRKLRDGITGLLVSHAHEGGGRGGV